MLRRAFPVLLVLLIVLPATVARAHFCAPACTSGARQCASLAIQLAKGCRLVCKETFPADAGARRTCADSCKAALASDKTACAGDGESCRSLCAAAADQECADDICSVAYNHCRDIVRDATRDCASTAADGTALQSCVEPGDAGTSLGRAALDDCITNMTSGLAACIAGC